MTHGLTGHLQSLGGPLLLLFLAYDPAYMYGWLVVSPKDDEFLVGDEVAGLLNEFVVIGNMVFVDWCLVVGHEEM